MTAPTPNASRCIACDHKQSDHDHDGPCFHSNGGLPCSCMSFSPPAPTPSGGGGAHRAPHAQRYAMRFEDEVMCMEEVDEGGYVSFDEYETLRKQYDHAAAALLASRRGEADATALLRRVVLAYDTQQYGSAQWADELDIAVANARAALAATPEEK